VRTPIKRTPVILRTPVQRPITVGSRIKVKVADKKQCDCLTVGRTGKVARMYTNGACYVILDCGHMCNVPLANLEKSNFDKCVNCRELKHRSELRVPSFWRGGSLCPECWKALGIDKHEKRNGDTERSTRGKRSPRS